MTPTEDTPNPAADGPPARTAGLSELSRQAKAVLASRRDAQQDITARIETQLDQLSEQLADELERRRNEAEQQARAEIDTLSSDLEAARQEFDEQREEWERVCSEVEKKLADDEQRIVQREQEAEQAAAANKQERRELDRWAGELADERIAIESERRSAPPRDHEDSAVEVKAANDRADKASAERDALAEQLEAAERASAASASALETDNQALRERLEQLEASQAHANDEGQANGQLQELRQQHQEEASAWDAERATLMDSLTAAADELDRVKQQGESSTAELQSKFDLALADVERLRSRVDEQDQELAERPAAGAAESAELAELRSEREELASQLEAARATASTGASSGDQETEDLRRRFEMAVEDVRQLKTENAKLEQQIADTASSAISGIGGDAMDWEAQKRRMLAELEGEAPPADEDRQKERATIEGTIRITDEVVAEKDREIASLRDQLESAPPADADPVEQPPPLSDDERLAAERERLATLEEEWRNKLRAAELEVSVERAKIAREQAELAEWRIELESMQNANGDRDADAGGKSQRRWLDKLGLGGAE